MRIPQSGLRIDNPAFPLLQAQISYWGITTGAGDALGTTLVDALCGTAGAQPSYVGQIIKILDGLAAGQVRPIAIHALATGTLTVAASWTNPAGAPQQITASTRFVILSAAGGGGAGPPPAPPAPGVGLWMFGVCNPGMAASPNTLVMSNLAGFNNDLFNNEFWVEIIHNVSAPGVAPEREIRRVLDYAGATGTFITDPFSVNVEANDLVCVFHESIMAIEIMGYGTLDTDSATVPADSTRAAAHLWENDDYFNGCLLIPTEGVCRMQPRRIIDYANGTGQFWLDPNNPLSQAPGLVDYVIVGDQSGYHWPYILATMDALDSPQVGQSDIEVARLSIHNLRPDTAIIQVAEYALTAIDIDRYRLGVDVAWTNIVAGVLMTEAIGYAFYTYTFPAASWQDGDLIRYRISGAQVNIPVGGAVFFIPEQTRYGVVGGITAIGTKLDLVFDLVNAIFTLKETGGTITTTGAVQDVYRNEIPLGVFKPKKVLIDTTLNTAAETIVISVSYRIAATPAAYVLKDTVAFAGVQAVPLKNIDLEPNRFGILVTLQRTAGGAKDYPYEVFWED